jgi:ElaB/YqjD/DUF883 family membrane-anchored ribosome-binding protein
MSIDKKVDETKDSLNRVAEEIGERVSQVKNQAEEYSDELAKYIKKCPVKSVLIASAIGLLVGKFIL